MQFFDFYAAYVKVATFTWRYLVVKATVKSNIALEIQHDDTAWAQMAWIFIASMDLESSYFFF